MDATSDKANSELTPDEVNSMPLAEFEERFGFRPADALEKHYFAGMAKPLDPTMRAMINAIGPMPSQDILDSIVME